MRGTIRGAGMAGNREGGEAERRTDSERSSAGSRIDPVDPSRAMLLSARRGGIDENVLSGVKGRRTMGCQLQIDRARGTATGEEDTRMQQRCMDCARSPRRGRQRDGEKKIVHGHRCHTC